MSHEVAELKRMKLEFKIYLLIFIGLCQFSFSQNIGNEYCKVDNGFYFTHFLVFENLSEGSFKEFTHYGKMENNFKYSKNKDYLILNCKWKDSYNIIIDKDILIDNEEKTIYVDMKNYVDSHLQKFELVDNKLEQINEKTLKELIKNSKNKWIVGYDAYKKYGYDYVLGVLEIN